MTFDLERPDAHMQIPHARTRIRFSLPTACTDYRYE